MLSQVSLGLVAIYAFVVALLLLVMVYGRMPWLAKAGIIGAALAFFILSFLTYSDLSGLPRLSRPPDKLLFVSTLVREPEKNFPGAIYLWARPIVDGKASAVPQAFQVPYDKELHKKMNDARSRDRSGHQVLLETRIIEEPADEESDQPPGYSQLHLDFVLSENRAAQLPEKTQQYLADQDEN